MTPNPQQSLTANIASQLGVGVNVPLPIHAGKLTPIPQQSLLAYIAPQLGVGAHVLSPIRAGKYPGVIPGVSLEVTFT